MDKLTYNLLKEINESEFSNIPTSPLWLLKKEKIFHKGSYFLKVYFVLNQSNLTINEVTLKITYQNKTVEYKTSELTRASSYPKDPVFGSSIKLPEDYKDEEVELSIIGLIVNTKLTDLSNLNQVKLKYELLLLDDPKDKYLETKYKNYVTFPRVFEDNWQCYCGVYNNNRNLECRNCHTQYVDIQNLVDLGIEKSSLKFYIQEHPFIVDVHMKFSDSFIDYVKSIQTKFNVEEMNVLELLDKEQEERKYNELYQIYLTEKVNRRKNIKKLAIISSSIVITISLFMIFVFPFLKYQLGNSQLEVGNYESAINTFESLGDYKDSKSKFIDATYLNTINLLDTMTENHLSITLEEIESINQIIQFDLKNHPKIADLKGNVYYLYAKYYSRIHDYESSIYFFQLISDSYLSKSKLEQDVISNKYRDTYLLIDINEDHAISEIESFIQIVKSDYHNFEKSALLTKAKNDIIKNAFIDHHYLNEFPSRSEYDIAVRYLRERNATGDQEKIDILNIAAALNGKYTHCRYKFYDGSCATATVYLNIVEKKIYYQYDNDSSDTWFAKNLSYINWDRYDLLSRYDDSYEGKLYKSGSSLILDWDGSVGVLTSN